MKNKYISYLAILLLAFVWQAGTASAKVINDPEYDFQITIPNNWQTNSFVDGTDKVWAFAAPDNNAAVRIRSFRAPAGLTMDLLVSAFETHILKGGQRLTLQPYTLNGIGGKMAGYKGQFNNTDVGVGCFYAIQNGNAYIVWSMIPVSLFHARSPEADAILNTFTLSRTGSAHPPMKPHAGNGAFAYQIMTVDDSGFEFLYPKHFKPFQQSEGQSQWADPDAPAGSRVVMVIQTMSRSAGNSLQSVQNKLSNQVASTAAAKLLGAKQLRVNGIPAYELRFTLRQQNDLKLFYYLVLDVKGPNVATVSFVGAQPAQEEVKQHFARLKESVKQTGMSGPGGGRSDVADECRRLGEVYTDGTGDNRTKKRGGTYIAIPKADLPMTSTLNIKALSGNLSYVTVHARYDGGIWKTAYQGPSTQLAVNQFKSVLSQSNCTHLIVSVNGAHEVYTSIPCKAEIKVCQEAKTADECRRLGEVYTDGTGDNKTKKRGGTYIAIPKADLPMTSSLNIKALSGNLSYVTVHARYDGGIWKTAYQGPSTQLAVNQFQSVLSQSNCTHLIVSVNGAHEVYTSIPCKAEIKVCP
ncbi:MAG: photosystem II reaction center PsbP family protein [Deltaproteobacteria bacterium]